VKTVLFTYPENWKVTRLRGRTMRVSVEMAETLNRATNPPAPPPPPQPRRPEMNLLQAKKWHNGKFIFASQQEVASAQEKLKVYALKQKWKNRYKNALQSLRNWGEEVSERVSEMEARVRQARKVERELNAQVRAWVHPIGGELKVARDNRKARASWEKKLTRLCETLDVFVPNPNGGLLPADVSEGYACLKSMDAAHEATCLGTPVWVKQGESYQRLGEYVDGRLRELGVTL